MENISQNTILDSMKIDYDKYLFAQLLCAYDQNFAELPYDEQWDLIPQFWKDFEKSEYNDREVNLYDCIVEYLNNEYLPMSY